MRKLLKALSRGGIHVIAEELSKRGPGPPWGGPQRTRLGRLFSGSSKKKNASWETLRVGVHSETLKTIYGGGKSGENEKRGTIGGGVL